MELSEVIVERIESLTKTKGITVNILLKECGINKSLLSDLKSKGSMPSADKLKKIADFFGVTTDYLLGRSDKKSITPDVLAFHKNTPGDFTEDEKEEIDNFIQYIISKRDKE